MRRNWLPFLLCPGVCAAILACAGNVGAMLGGTVDSVEPGRKILRANRGAAVTPAEGRYTVHEATVGATQVREYVSPSGTIFAVAWDGVMHPELTDLLGSYADEYRKALQENPPQPGARRQTITSDRIVVEKWGHVRDLHGRAYVPDFIPSGVDIDEIQ
jgi:hypothetical protein